MAGERERFEVETEGEEGKEASVTGERGCGRWK